MKLTRKLLDLLHSAFSDSAEPFVAFRLHYDGMATWHVSDGIFSTEVIGGTGTGISIALSGHTLETLVSTLAGLTGYSTSGSMPSRELSARVLLDMSGSTASSDTDSVLAYSSLLYAYLDPVAVELKRAKDQIDAMLDQMVVHSAEGEWLDEWGSYFGIPRAAGENDEAYAPRMIAEIFQPKSNNIAIAEALRAAFNIAASVDDVVIFGSAYAHFDGSFVADGSHVYDSSVQPIYGLFDVSYAYDLLSGGDMTAFAKVVRKFIERFRAAGTQMRSLSLTGSSLADTAAIPTDGGPLAFSVQASLTDAAPVPVESSSVIAVGMAGFSDVAQAPTEAAGIDVGYTTTFDGLRTFDGSVVYASGGALHEAL